MPFIRFNAKLEQEELSADIVTIRSFTYGDAHFTTMKVIQAEIKLWPLHLARLQHASEKLGFNDIDWQKLEQVCHQQAKSIEQGIMKLHINRGRSVRGYGHTSVCEPDIFMSLQQTEFPDVEPVILTQVDFQLGISPYLAGLKHCNRIEQVMISRELDQKGASDGLVTDINGILIETNKANLFWLENGKWYTPSIKSAGVDGVMRQAILGVASHISETEAMRTHVLANAQSIVVCNSLIGLVAVEAVDDISFDTAVADKFIKEISALV
jgi:4-amino-4-deoxychorismate lyase